jgi:hypothetical protein
LETYKLTTLRSKTVLHKLPQKTAVVESAVKKPIMTGGAEETTELCDDASKPEMEKAEAEEPAEQLR